MSSTFQYKGTRERVTLVTIFIYLEKLNITIDWQVLASCVRCVWSDNGEVWGCQLCQPGPRQKLDAKFKQGSKLNFNKPLTSFLLPLPETHNAWLDRRCHLTKCCNLKVFQGYWKCSCLRMISSELYAWPRAIVKLIWLSGVTNKLKSYKSENTGPWSRCLEVSWVCHVTAAVWRLSWQTPSHDVAHTQDVSV